MGIERRGKNSWRIGTQVPTEGGYEWIRRTVKFPPTMSEEAQRSAAEIELKRLEVEIADGKIKPSAKPDTVRTLADKWEQRHLIPNCSPVTVKNYRHMLDKRILPKLGDLPITRVTPSVIADFMAELRQEKKETNRKPDDQLKHPRSPSDIKKMTAKNDATISDRTARHYYDCLKFMFAKAVQWEMLRTNPVDKVDRPKFRKRPTKYLDDDQAVELLRKLGNEKDMSFRAAVLLALLGGLRLGEVGELRWSDVDWGNGTIDITRALKYTPRDGSFIGDPKSETSARVLDLPPGMMALLHETKLYQDDIAANIGDRWRGEGLIVCDWDGSQLHHDTPSKQWRRFADKNGCKGVRFHDLRHTHATILLANNLDAVTVASRLGHASAVTTLKDYAHVLRRRDRQSTLVMQNLLDRAQDTTPNICPPEHSDL